MTKAECNEKMNEYVKEMDETDVVFLKHILTRCGGIWRKKEKDFCSKMSESTGGRSSDRVLVVFSYA